MAMTGKMAATRQHRDMRFLLVKCAYARGINPKGQLLAFD
jgi:hypothetical protein